MTESITGGCHCGQVRYTCTEAPVSARHCHCTDCRKLSGSGHASNLRLPTRAFTVTGQPKGYAVVVESGNRIERFFCGICGTPLFAKNTGAPDFVAVRASSLDDPARFEPEEVIWAASAVPWDRVNPDLPAYSKGPPSPK
jgi:hypothetical protein